VGRIRDSLTKFSWSVILSGVGLRPAVGVCTRLSEESRMEPNQTQVGKDIDHAHLEEGIHGNRLIWCSEVRVVGCRSKRNPCKSPLWQKWETMTNNLQAAGTLKELLGLANAGVK
jgi:hypothetical protein